MASLATPPPPPMDSSASFIAETPPSAQIEREKEKEKSRWNNWRDSDKKKVPNRAVTVIGDSDDNGDSDSDGAKATIDRKYFTEVRARCSNLWFRLC